MSPEQAELKNVDNRTDIYSLGVVLFEMLTGRVPFEGETPLSIAIKHQSEPPRSPRDLNAHVPDDLATVVLKALSKNPARRYQSAEEMAADLENVACGLPLTDTRPARREPITSREITVKFRLKKLVVPGLILAEAALGVVFLRPVLFPGTKPAAAHRQPGLPSPSEYREGERAGKSSAGSSGPLSRLGSGAIRLLKSRDLSDLNDAEKFLETIQTVLPRDSNLRDAVSSTSEKVRESKKLSEEGRTEEAQRAGREGREEMRKLMAQVAERDGALDATAAAREARDLAARGGRDGRNLLFRLAEYEEKNAEAAPYSPPNRIPRPA